MDIVYVDNDEIEKQEEKPVTPTFALVFHNQGNHSKFVTHHDIKDGDLLDGIYLEPEEVCKMTMASLKREIELETVTNTDFIPEHVIVDKPKKVVWFRPKSTRVLCFDFGSKKDYIKAQLPALLFLHNGCQLKIAALKENKRPNLATEIFHAPLMNINSQFSLCLGAAKLPEVSSLEAVLKETENCFFEFNCTHVNHSHTLSIAEKVTTNALYDYFKEQERGKVSDFNVDHLKSASISLEGFIR